MLHLSNFSRGGRIEAPKAPMGWSVGGDVPLPIGRGLEEGQPSPEIFFCF